MEFGISLLEKLIWEKGPTQKPRQTTADDVEERPDPAFVMLKDGRGLLR